MSKNNHASKRTQARRHVVKILAEQGGKCYWCPRPLIAVATLDPQSIVGKGRHNVVWKEEGRLHSCRIATIDHVTPLSEGGSNARGNLVAACAECNGKRTATPSPKPLHERRKCPRCGRSKDLHRSMCLTCHREIVRQHEAGKVGDTPDVRGLRTAGGGDGVRLRAGGDADHEDTAADGRGDGDQQGGGAGSAR